MRTSCVHPCLWTCIHDHVDVRVPLRGHILQHDSRRRIAWEVTLLCQGPSRRQTGSWTDAGRRSQQLTWPKNRDALGLEPCIEMKSLPWCEGAASERPSS